MWYHCFFGRGAFSFSVSTTDFTVLTVQALNVLSSTNSYGTNHFGLDFTCTSNCPGSRSVFSNMITEYWLCDTLIAPWQVEWPFFSANFPEAPFSETVPPLEQSSDIFNCICGRDWKGRHYKTLSRNGHSQYKWSGFQVFLVSLSSFQFLILPVSP